jgi:3-phenylpropionate/trans-cinnamate dioxygenase ferredoxin component
MTWIKVSDSNLRNGDLIGFDYDNKKKLLIAKVQDKIYATDGICTHEYADLSSLPCDCAGERVYR